MAFSFLQQKTSQKNPVKWIRHKVAKINHLHWKVLHLTSTSNHWRWNVTKPKNLISVRLKLSASHTVQLIRCAWWAVLQKWEGVSQKQTTGEKKRKVQQFSVEIPNMLGQSPKKNSLTDKINFDRNLITQQHLISLYVTVIRLQTLSI